MTTSPRTDDLASPAHAHYGERARSSCRSSPRRPRKARGGAPPEGSRPAATRAGGGVGGQWGGEVDYPPAEPQCQGAVRGPALTCVTCWLLLSAAAELASWLTSRLPPVHEASSERTAPPEHKTSTRLAPVARLLGREKVDRARDVTMSSRHAREHVMEHGRMSGPMHRLGEVHRLVRCKVYSLLPEHRFGFFAFG